MIPEAAVEAVVRQLWDVNEHDDEWVDDFATYNAYLRHKALQVLEAAAPHMTPKVEWGIFRVHDDETATPTENRRYRTREIAERQILHDYNQPKFWEVRGRSVGEWTRRAD